MVIHRPEGGGRSVFSELCSALYFSLAIVVFERNCRVPLPAASASGHDLFFSCCSIFKDRFAALFLAALPVYHPILRLSRTFLIFFKKNFDPASLPPANNREAAKHRHPLARGSGKERLYKPGRSRYN